MIYSLNIGGVKRWLALSNKTTSKGLVSAKTSSSYGGKSDSTKDASAPWWTTSAMATRLLEPQVSQTELKEYKK